MITIDDAIMLMKSKALRFARIAEKAEEQDENMSKYYKERSENYRNVAGWLKELKEIKVKTVSQQIEEAKEEMCNNYCKYPNEYKPEEHDGAELWDSDICKNCPLTRL